MKKQIAVVLAAALCICAAGCAKKPDNRLEAIMEAGVITVCTSPDYAPYEFEILDAPDGSEKYVGSDMELARYIAEQLGVELEIKPMDFNTCLESVVQGTADLGISGFSWEKEREEAALLAGPYCMTNSDHQGCVLVKKDSGINTIADLAGKRVAAQNGSLQHSYMTMFAVESEQQTISSLADGVMMVEAGKIDALCISEVTGTQYIKSYDDLMLSELRFATEDGYYVLMGKQEQELYDAVLPIILKAEADGLYALWLEEAIALADSQGIDLK